MVDKKTKTKVQPIIQDFWIYGLNGDRDIGLSFTSNVCICASENGTGKTTLLNALHLILTRNFRVKKINFKKIEIKFLSKKQPLRFYREELRISEKEIEDAHLSHKFFGLLDGLTHTEDLFELVNLIANNSKHD